MAIAAILRRDHHWSGNFLQDGGEEIYRNGTESSYPACSSGESDELVSPSRGLHQMGLQPKAHSAEAGQPLGSRGITLRSSALRLIAEMIIGCGKHRT